MADTKTEPKANKSITITIPTEVYDRIEAARWDLRKERSEIFREAVIAYADKIAPAGK